MYDWFYNRENVDLTKTFAYINTIQSDFIIIVVVVVVAAADGASTAAVVVVDDDGDW